MIITMTIITYIPVPVQVLIYIFKFTSGSCGIFKCWYYMWVASQYKGCFMNDSVYFMEYVYAMVEFPLILVLLILCIKPRLCYRVIWRFLTKTYLCYIQYQAGRPHTVTKNWWQRGRGPLRCPGPKVNARTCLGSGPPSDCQLSGTVMLSQV